jgi:hypothetical protein
VPEGVINVESDVPAASPGYATPWYDEPVLLKVMGLVVPYNFE